jgi:Sulfotransferase domain
MTKQNGRPMGRPALIPGIDEVGPQRFVRCRCIARNRGPQVRCRVFLAPRQSSLETAPVDGNGKTFLNGFHAPNGGELGIEFWDEDEIETLDTYKGKVRVIRAVVTPSDPPDSTPHTWCFALLGCARKLSRRTALKAIRARWHIGITAFHQWIKYWNLGHVFHHTPNALLALLLLWMLAFDLSQLFIYRRLKRPWRPKDPTDTIRRLVEVMLREMATLLEPIPWMPCLDTSWHRAGARAPVGGRECSGSDLYPAQHRSPARRRSTRPTTHRGWPKLTASYVPAWRTRLVQNVRGPRLLLEAELLAGRQLQTAMIAPLLGMCYAVERSLCSSNSAMIRRLIAGTKLAFGLHRPGRNLVVFPDDTFLVSYPKSGNTWTRFLIANLAYPEKHPDFSNINELTPDPEALSKRHLASMPRPRILKSHQYFDPRIPRVIYVVRDARDVALSQYHFQRKRRVIEDDYPIGKFVTRFLAGETTPYGSWGENVASWLVTRYGHQGFLLLRYEDMVADTPTELAKVAAFLGIPADPSRIAHAVAQSSSDKMRELESTQFRLWSGTRETRRDLPFVRSAKAGGWKSGLPEASVRALELAWSPLMKWLGYELVSSPAEDVRSAQLQESLLGERTP